MALTRPFLPYTVLRSKIAQATAGSDLPIFTVAGSQYKGQSPQFAQIRVNPKDRHSPMTWIRTMKGIPFVNVTQK